MGWIGGKEGEKEEEKEWEWGKEEQVRENMGTLYLPLNIFVNLKLL